MTPEEMLNERMWLEGLVKAAGGRITSADVDMQEPAADFTFVRDTREFYVRIEFRREQTG